MTIIAYAFPPASPPRNSKTEKRINGPRLQPTLPAVRQAILELIAWPPLQRCPRCPKMDLQEQRPK
jgi:hypothetical protein